MRKLPRLRSRTGSDFMVRDTPVARRPDCPATRRIDSECLAYVAQARAKASVTPSNIPMDRVPLPVYRRPLTPRGTCAPLQHTFSKKYGSKFHRLRIGRNRYLDTIAYGSSACRSTGRSRSTRHPPLLGNMDSARSPKANRRLHGMPNKYQRAPGHELAQFIPSDFDSYSLITVSAC